MSYRIVYQPRAINEYEEATAWYKERSVQAAENFEAAVNSKIDFLRVHPLRYKRLTKIFMKYEFRNILSTLFFLLMK